MRSTGETPRQPHVVLLPSHSQQILAIVGDFTGGIAQHLRLPFHRHQALDVRPVAEDGFAQRLP